MYEGLLRGEKEDLFMVVAVKKTIWLNKQDFDRVCDS